MKPGDSLIERDLTQETGDLAFSRSRAGIHD
jgi:hypothetical protein